MADCAYGDGGTRQAFADAQRVLIAKVAGRPNKAYFPKRISRLTLKQVRAPVLEAAPPEDYCGLPNGRTAPVDHIGHRVSIFMGPHAADARFVRLASLPAKEKDAP